ncbi:MAG: 50S ribosomal protein L25 [Candidatus Portnoybacteria bacterium]|nr:50S ribosomal protein L25 [Candidatus Portnoybacteria bacterium]
MTLELKAKIREKKKSKLRALREKGLIPAIVYGPGHKPVLVKVDYSEFKKALKEAGETTIVKLKIEDKEKKESVKNVIIHDIAKNPVTDEFIHIDFYQVRMDKAITAEIPLVFEGEAPAVKSLEGTFVKNMNEIEVEGLPGDLPHEIKIDISSLKTFEDYIRIKDVNFPQGVKPLADQERVVASVEPPRSEEELAELEEKPEEEVEEVEKVGEEEPEEEVVTEEEPEESKPAEGEEK